MRKALSSIALYLLLIIPANAAPPSFLKEYFTDAKEVGSGRLTYMIWDAYDATLYAPLGAWKSEKPFALKLHYLRSIDGGDIAKRSVEEIRGLGFKNELKLAAWYAQMSKIFPNVKNGTELTGIFIPNQPTHFYQGDTHIGTVTDPEFGIWFFNIWLAEGTSVPQLRQQLLALQ